MNRLSNELSPYLKAHSTNPVNWYPWEEEAIERAKREDKPIFLSIGYNSCHWCHIMEVESFENSEVAEILNDKFISIKVDKEERVDIDKHFQDIFVAMSGKVGGWPLSIFMTPNKEPIFSATYIPLEDSYGIMGFRKLLNIISKKYNTQRDEIVKKAQEVLESIKPQSRIKATKITKDLIKIASSSIKSTYDRENGGFGEAPKFPRVSALSLTLRLYKITKDSELLKIVTDSLDKMSIGGLYDLIDGGYHRYCIDEKWLVPHFEKMLYDNALMIEILVDVYEVTGEERYLKLAKDTADFLINKMSESGLFFSGVGADSGGVEGGYSIYSFDEVAEAFEANGLDLDILDRLNITKEGSFEGQNIIRLSSWEDLEDSRVQEAIEILKQIRKTREYPQIDRKILTSWSAMATKSIFRLSKVQKSYLEIAKASLSSLRDYMSQGNRLYHSGLVGHQPNIDGFLEDYAYLSLAMIEAYRATQEEFYLKFAQDLINEAIKRFYKGGRWIISDGEFRDFVDDRDSSYPSAIAIVLEALLHLRDLKDTIYEKFIFKTLEVSSYELMRQPLPRAKLAEVAIEYLQKQG